jgi:2-polyprenyl-3-methyl-5-hydroxy-6-metoxy-1,4-benzoquinol methylase
VKERRPSTHYSYSMYADPEMARSFDDRRFGGPIGDLVARAQARVLANMVGRIQERRILDVGTGTGRVAILLAHGAAKVTAVDASEQMLAIARRRAEEALVKVKFKVGDAHHLEFPDRDFDAVVAFRLLMHTPEWKRCLGEMCRVSDRLVIIDYPSASSFALFEAMARRVAHAVGLRTEPYRVFSRGAIAAALDQNGYRIRSMHRQFVLPIAFHKALGSRKFTLWSERVLDRLGLLKPFGSPVTLVAERCDP